MAINALPSSIGSLLPSGAVSNAPPAEDVSPAGSFGESLNKMLKAVDSTTGEANSAVSDMMAGTGDVHTAMIAMQRAEMTFQMTVQIKNKLMQAYQDVMRMTV